jgi:hypothetical protein
LFIVVVCRLCHCHCCRFFRCSF